MGNEREFERRASSARRSADYHLERLLLDINEQICGLMSGQGISRSELAARLNVSRAWVTKLLRGDRNVTLRSLVTVAHELGFRMELGLIPRAFGYEEEWSPATIPTDRAGRAISAFEEVSAAQGKEARERAVAA